MDQTASVDMSKIMKDATLIIRATGERRLSWRIRFAKPVLILAAAILGVGTLELEFKYDK